MINILVISHGELGAELVRTAELIVGGQERVTALSLTKGDSLPGMFQKVAETLDRLEREGDGTLVLTDMLGGTPCNACLPLSTTHRIEIVSGANLYMVISAFTNRMYLGLEDLAQKVISDGQKNIADAKEMFMKKLG